VIPLWLSVVRVSFDFWHNCGILVSELCNHQINHMPVYQFKRTQELKASISEVWGFIKNPKNLKEITPDYMGFKVTSELLANEMYPGMIISYEVKPVLGIPMTWVTEITHVEEPYFFVDEQRKGPYKMWHHEHKLEETKDGVLMTDLITYEPPLGFLGTIANGVFIKSQLNEIFEYRKQVLDKKFNLPIIQMKKGA